MYMKQYKHLPNYTKPLIPFARKLRREMTDAEYKLWSQIRDNQLGIKLRRQVVFGPYILDFFSAKAKLVIELDGGQHNTEEGIIKDQIRDAYLNENGLEVLRFSDIEVLENITGVMQTIYEAIKKNKQSRPHPNLPLRGGGIRIRGEGTTGDLNSRLKIQN